MTDDRLKELSDLRSTIQLYQEQVNFLQQATGYSSSSEFDVEFLITCRDGVSVSMERFKNVDSKTGFEILRTILTQHTVKLQELEKLYAES